MKKHYWIGLLLAGVLTACATSPERQAGAPLETWVSYSDEITSLKKLPQGHAGMVFVRQHDAVPGPALNIFINQKYHNSILPGAYSQAVVCPRSEQKVSLAFISIKERAQDKAAKGVGYAAPVEKNTVFLVQQDAQGKPVLKQINDDQFRSLLTELKQQTNILSRIGEDGPCAPEAENTVQ
ncbi:MAG: hypothetical protein Q4G42_03970 [Neisseria sp.]|nr:hypothetical protein [Neisseria sp.]